MELKGCVMLGGKSEGVRCCACADCWVAVHLAQAPFVFMQAGIPENIPRIAILRIYKRLGLGVSISGDFAGSMDGGNLLILSGDQAWTFR